MSCSLVRTTGRKYPLRRPADWVVKFPRYMLELPQDVDQISITYIGVQPRQEDDPVRGSHTDRCAHITNDAQRRVAAKVDHWINDATGPLAPALSEKLYVETGYEVPDTEMYILYRTNKGAASHADQDLDIAQLHRSLSLEDQQITVYSGNDYRPGIASLPGVEQVRHNFTGYWGAARDRLPESADDLFDSEASLPVPQFDTDTKHRATRGSNMTSMVHIRSGQYWERCKEDEREAYEQKLEPVLREAMAYLEQNAAETGDCGLRFSRNLTTNKTLQVEESARGFQTDMNRSAQDGLNAPCTDGTVITEPNSNEVNRAHRPRRETCSSGFFRSLKDLEHWAAKHPTHHKIFHGAHAHSTKFGKTTYRMRTWHEVAALKPDEMEV